MTEYYVSGCIEIDGTVGRETDEDAEFFTLYGKDDQGISQCIADFTDRLSAEAAMQVYQERDALQQQVNALADKLARSEDYCIGVDTERMEYINKCEALAAEALYLKDEIVQHSQATHFCKVCGEDDPCVNDDVCWALTHETPATDAIKRQWMDEALSCVPYVCDGKEQKAFEFYAKEQRWDLQQHPLHYLFLDDKTNTARNAWRECLNYVAAQSRQPEEKNHE